VGRGGGGKVRTVEEREEKSRSGEEKGKREGGCLTSNESSVNLYKSVVGARESEGVADDNRTHCSSKHTRVRATSWKETALMSEV